MLVRTVECIDGSVEIELVCEPVFDYGREPGEWSLVDDDRHTADVTARATIRLRTDMALGIEGERVRARHVLHAGERLFCSLSWAERLGVGRRARRRRRGAGGDDALLAPLVRARALPDHGGASRSQRSILAIKGLTYMPTGATVAAATTSLPETPGGERNWDYRYTWMRDSTFTLQALHFLNLDWEADEFMQFVADLEPNDDGGLQIMYGIDGRRDLTESTRDDLSGYDGARPVRIGNGAFDQRQNDVFGAVLDCDPAAHRAQPAAAAAAVADRPDAGRVRDRVWREPDQGIWEARGAPQHYVSSKLMCWVAMDRAAKIAAHPRRPRPRSERWRATADEIRADILEHGLTRRGVLRQHYDTDALDASNLLAAIFGFLPGEDERLRASVLGDRRRADRERLRPALPHRRDRRRPLGQGGEVPDLLVLAGVGAGHRSATCSGRVT